MADQTTRQDPTEQHRSGDLGEQDIEHHEQVEIDPSQIHSSP